jgi:VWFA-related protein
MQNPLRFPFTRRTSGLLLKALLAASCTAFQVHAQEAPAKSETQPQPPTTQAPGNGTSEVSTRDTPPTFRVRVNLVLVRVVVRDSSGKVVANLKKEDFQLSDNRKPQVISTFSTETPESHKLATPAAAPNPDGSEPGDTAAAIAALPQRFVAVVFDDTNMLVEDTVWVRSAATRLFASLAPTDRVGIYSTSGQLTQEFTQEHERLQESLLGVVPRPATGTVGFHDCPEISYYQADQIVNRQDSQALMVATQDALECAYGNDPKMTAQAQILATMTSERTLATGDSQTAYVYRHLEDITRRLAGMPGQRVMVFVSPGFVITSMLTSDSSSLIDRANRANIVINTIDARGLYTPDLLGDIADPPHDSMRTAGIKSSYRIQSQLAQSDILGQLADGTGGTFFHNRNDIDEGLREATAAPAMSYLLGFSPQNLKLNGAYHTLKVTLAGKQKFNVQARHGYYAPRTIKDPAEAAKEEIQEALFSQDEIHDLPVELQTQFFKKDPAQARLAVLTHLDVKGIRFRKVDGRNNDDLTVATAIFDENGNFVTGGEKIVEMKLLDRTFERLSRSGFTLKSSFDVKPGTYLVRMVVRDAEGAQMAARNGAVSIPY